MFAVYVLVLLVTLLFFTSALAQYAPAPTHLIWWALLAVFVAGILSGENS